MKRGKAINPLKTTWFFLIVFKYTKENLFLFHNIWALQKLLSWTSTSFNNILFIQSVATSRSDKTYCCLFGNEKVWMKVMHILLSPLFFNHKLSQVFSEMKFRIVLLFLMFTWNRPHRRDVLTMRFCSERFNHFFRSLPNFRCFGAIFWCDIQHAPNQTLKTLIPIIHYRIVQYH